MNGNDSKSTERIILLAEAAMTSENDEAYDEAYDAIRNDIDENYGVNVESAIDVADAPIAGAIIDMAEDAAEFTYCDIEDDSFEIMLFVVPVIVIKEAGASIPMPNVDKFVKSFRKLGMLPINSNVQIVNSYYDFDDLANLRFSDVRKLNLSLAKVWLTDPNSANPGIINEIVAKNEDEEHDKSLNVALKFIVGSSFSLIEEDSEEPEFGEDEIQALNDDFQSCLNEKEAGNSAFQVSPPVPFHYGLEFGGSLYESVVRRISIAKALDDSGIHPRGAEAEVSLEDEPCIVLKSKLDDGNEFARIPISFFPTQTDSEVVSDLHNEFAESGMRIEDVKISIGSASIPLALAYANLDDETNLSDLVALAAENPLIFFDKPKPSKPS